MFEEAVVVAIATNRFVTHGAGPTRVVVDHVLADHAQVVVEIDDSLHLSLEQELNRDATLEEVKVELILVGHVVLAEA